MVLSCKETFALLYKEMDSPIEATLSSSSSSHQQIGAASNASFAHSDSYSLIDAIAADEGRFTSNTDVVINTEIRSIPVGKRGVYFAFRDQGACLSLISIKVYHLYCPKLYTNFAYFNSTPTGSGESSLVAVEGSCVPNSIQIEQPKMFCTADGTWNTMSSGQCKCLAGFEPASNQTKCQACPPGKFKSTLGDLSCQVCPERSSAPFAGATECKCHDGYFRSSKDSRSMPCTQPPSSPLNLSATYIDSTSVILQWQQPRSTGNRDDLTYKLICDSCDQTMVSSPIFYSNFSETKCVLSGLSPSTIYRFVLYSMNGVSQLASATLQSQPQFSEITIQTLKPVLQTTQNTLSAQGGFQMTPIYNFRAIPGARGSDMVLAWDVQPYQSSESGAGSSSVLESIVNNQQSLSDTQQYPSLYEIKYQPRHYLTPSSLDASTARARSSPYPNSLIGVTPSSILPQQLGPLSVTTTNKALVITTLQPNTEYAFQIRTKWSHTNQWTEFSAPIYMSTTNQMLSSLSNSMPTIGQDNFGITNYDPIDKLSMPQTQFNQASNTQAAQSTNSGGSGWLGTFLLVSMSVLISLAVLSITFIRYRKTSCMQSLAGNFGSFAGGGSGGGGSTYAGVYGTNVASGLMGGVGPLGFGGPLGHTHHHHHATLSASSAGGLITGSNGTSRSSSGGGGGAGSVVQNFIAATLGQISGANHSNNNRASKASAFASPLAHNTSSQTMGGDGKLFAPPTSQQQPRNHYHQTLSGMNHTMLLNGGHGHFEQVTGAATGVNVAQLNGITGGNNQFSANNNNQPLVDPFKYRTLGQPGE